MGLCSSNIVVVLGLMQLAKKIPFEDQNVLWAVRGLYILSNLVIFGFYFYVGKQIKQKNGTAPLSPLPCSFTYFERGGTFRSSRRMANSNEWHYPDMTTLKYVEPAAPLSGEEPKLVTTTVLQYDESQLKSLYKSQLTGMAMVGFMHLYLKYTNPLLIQSIVPLKGALEGNLVKIHVWGQPASGDLKRPWKAGGFMGAAGGETKSDRKSVEQAEKQYRGGAKEE
ncbi:hypothetical protein ABW21_db0208958 [Orbilia brochopaga]|nr:hypothetical protein ABW21_db0208958 [Drechslerella brochopaga]